MDLALELSPGLEGSPSYGDLMLVNGDFAVTADALGGTTHPVLQDLHIRLRTYLGEWFMDSRLGIPWRQLTDAANTAPTQLDAVLQNAICTTPGIIQLSNYTSSFNSRQRLLSVSFTAISTKGPISYSTQLSSNTVTEGNL